MPNLLIVTLDNDSKPPCLNVVDEQGNPNHVKRDPDWQTIRWKLDVKDPHASFNSQADSARGFAWVGSDRPPAGVFSEPVLRKHGKVLTIADLNDSDSDSTTTGDWEYQLNATIDGLPYQTNVDRTTTNPRIKNTRECCMQVGHGVR